MEFIKGTLAAWLLFINFIITSILFYLTLEAFNYKNCMDFEDYALGAFIINTTSLFFEITFFLTFFVSERGCCCNKDGKGYENGNICNCCDELACCHNCTDNYIQNMMFIPLCMTVVFVISFFLNQACGRHPSRFSLIVTLFIIDFTLTMVSIYIMINFRPNIFIILIIIFSLIGALVNFLAAFLPNTIKFAKFRYDYDEDEDEEFALHSL